MEFKIRSKTYGDKTVEIDDDDYDRIRGYTWYLVFAKYSSASPEKPRVRCDVVKDGKRETLYLHKLLLPGVWRVEYIDGNPLNNRKSNLRRKEKKRTLPKHTHEEYKAIWMEKKRKILEKAAKKNRPRRIKKFDGDVCKYKSEAEAWAAMEEKFPGFGR